MRLRNKIIVITGASQGLGAILSQKAAEDGAHVVLISRSKEKLKQLEHTIQEKGGSALSLVCDITDSIQIQKIVKQIIAKYGTIDILVNNAGIWTDNSLEKEHPEKRKYAFETNSLGQIQFTEEVLPYFRLKNQGSIVNVISTSGTNDTVAGDNKYWKTYGATKWAMAGFTKALHDELIGTKIKVIGFYPGGFDSNLYENADLDNAHNQPWMMNKEDIADILLFTLTRPDDVLIEKIVITKVM